MLKKPHWLKVKLVTGKQFENITKILRDNHLHTVCEQAHCPNQCECWAKQGTATFMLMGDICTRACKFCAVKTGNPKKHLDKEEPRKLAEAIKKIKLKYAVLTSVDRDDLEDCGAEHLAECVKTIKQESPETKIEILIPDLNQDQLKIIIDSKPDVIGHNIEVVKELQKKARDPRAGYAKSLEVLKNIKELSDIYTKSSLLVGLGETKKQVLEAMKDLKKVDVDILTIGQYLQPKSSSLDVKEYIHPDIFKYYKQEGKKMDFLYVASGPFVRSSYLAAEFYDKYLIINRKINKGVYL